MAAIVGHRLLRLTSHCGAVATLVAVLDQPLIVRVGLRVAVLIGIVAIISVVADADDNAGIRPWLFVAQIAIFAYGGVRAAKRCAQAPITHGAAAAAAGLVAVIVVTTAARLLRGDGVSVIGIIFFLLLASSVGAIAAMIWSSRQSRSSDL